MSRNTRKSSEYTAQHVLEEFYTMPQCDLATSSAQDFMRLVAEIEPTIIRPRLALGAVALNVGGIPIPDATYQAEKKQRQIVMRDGPDAIIRARWGMDLSADSDRRRLAWLEFTKQYMINTQPRELSAGVLYRPSIAKSRQVEASYRNSWNTNKNWFVRLHGTKMYYSEDEHMNFEEAHYISAGKDPRICFAELAGQAAWKLLKIEEFIARTQRMSDAPLTERQKALLAEQEFSATPANNLSKRLTFNHDGLAVVVAGPPAHDEPQSARE